MSLTLTLTKPIPSFGGDPTSELTFREPNGNTLVKCGYPFRLVNSTKSGETVRTIDCAVVTQIISALTGVPPSSVLHMSWLDWTAALGVISGFLVDPAARKSSQPTSMSDDILTT